MLAGDFERKLRSLNRNLRIYCGNDDRYAAGIYIVSPSGEYTEICGVDKNYVPEYQIYRPDGGLFKSGWRRVLKILVAKGLIHRQKAQKEFSTYLLNTKAPTRPQIEKDAHLKKLKSMGIDIIDAGSY